jgi:integrase
MSVPNSVGSADPSKVLSPQQIAELERALGRDLRRYDKACARIQKELSLDLRSDDWKSRYSGFDVARYFGTNGHREHTAKELADLRGLGPNSAPEVPRRIRRFLSPIIGTELAVEIVKLRSQFERLRKQKKASELAASQQYISSALAGIDFSIHDKKAYCVERYFGLNGCRVQSMSSIQTALGLQTDRSVFSNIRSRLTLCVGERKTQRLLAIRRNLRVYLSRAIKAQALRLQLAVARRISAVVEIPLEPPTRVRMTEGRRIVEIQFRSGKTWGDEGLLEWVPCVDQFGEIAEDAIRTVRRLTKDLRVVAAEDLRERLFIVPDKSFDLTVGLSVDVLHQYIYTREEGKNAGVLRRYALEGLYDFEFHFMRHTHSTHMIEEGGTIQDVAQYLGHTSFSGSSAMAAIFYLAGGTEQMRKRTADALRKGAATGYVFDGVARLKIEAIGDDAKKEAVPPNQLSFELARERVLHSDVVEEVPIEPAEAAKLIDQKVIFNVTRYGGCLLQATSGHCPTANPCPIGILPKGVEPVIGCGCKYLVLLPESVEQLSQDIAIMEAQMREMKGEHWEAWRSHTDAKLAHYRSLLETAKSLNGSK